MMKSERIARQVMSTSRRSMPARSHMMSIDHPGTGDALGPMPDAVHGQQGH